MSDDKKQQDNSASPSPGNANNTSSINTGNEIPYVPPSDRTNLNESVDLDTDTTISANIKTDD